MHLDYSIVESSLKGAAGRHVAVPKVSRVYRMKDLLDVMAVPGGVTRVQAAAVIEAFAEAHEAVLASGASICTELYRIAPVIEGLFNGSNDKFDPARHCVSFRAQPGSRIRRIAASVTTRRVACKVRAPEVHSFCLMPRNDGETTAHAGDAAQLEGKLLRFDPADEDQGVFFVSKGVCTRVTGYLLTSRSRILFLLPEALAPASYRVEVRAMVYRTSCIRTGALTDPVKVQ